MLKNIVGVLLGALLLVNGYEQAQARENPQTVNKRPAKSQRAAPISAAQAAGIASSATGAKVLSVRSEGRFYRVKLLRQSGVVFSVNVDSRSGRVK